VTDKPPNITPELIADDQKLHRVIDTLLVDNQTYWRFCRRILKLQLRHQELASEDAFSAFLDVEAGMNEKHAWELALVARWAFEEGRRSVGRHR